MKTQLKKCNAKLNRKKKTRNRGAFLIPSERVSVFLPVLVNSSTLKRLLIDMPQLDLRGPKTETFTQTETETETEEKNKCHHTKQNTTKKTRKESEVSKKGSE